MYKFQKGDKIKVVAGKDKGKEGTIEQVNMDKHTVLVPGVNMYKKHVKGDSRQGGQKGGIYDIPRPLSVSKIMLIDPSTGKPTRIGFKQVGKKKVRIAKRSGKELKTKTK